MHSLLRKSDSFSLGKEINNRKHVFCNIFITNYQIHIVHLSNVKFKCSYNIDI